METLFIVVYRSLTEKRWKALSDGELPERRLAENLIECKRAAGYDWEFGIVEGPIVCPSDMAAAEAALGPF